LPRQNPFSQRRLAIPGDQGKKNAWIIEASSFDCCPIDHEHGAFDPERIVDPADWLQATSV
jgi:hypothetical protein